jgi:hypothetical protein
VFADELVPRRLGVEHGDPQLTARGDACVREGLLVDARLGVADLLQAERVGQPPRRIDGQRQHPAVEMDAAIAAALATVSSCRHRPIRRR